MFGSILSSGPSHMPNTRVGTPWSPKISTDFCLSLKALFVSAILSTPSTRTPAVSSQRRYPLPPLASLFLPLPTLGLQSFPHVHGFSWLITKDLAAFQRAKSARKWACEDSPHLPAGFLLPLPLGGAAAASRAGSLGRQHQGRAPSPPPPRSPSPPVAALLPSHRRTGREDAGVCSAPAPSLFLSFPALGSCCRCRERFEKSRVARGTGVQASAAARGHSWAHYIPGVASGPCCPGWAVTEESPRLWPPALEGAPRERVRGSRLASLRPQRRGTAPSSRSSERVRRDPRLPDAAQLRGQQRESGPSPASRRPPGVETSTTHPPALAVALAPWHLRQPAAPGSTPSQRPATPWLPERGRRHGPN